MSDEDKSEAVLTHEVKAEEGDGARYLYCVADSDAKMSLGRIGLDGQEVFTIPCGDLCAVVHICPPQPYQSEDNELVKGWVMIHEKVVETVWERFDTILPVGFDTIIKGEEDITPEENIRKWLKQDQAILKEKMNKIRGKAEYGIQIFWDPKLIAGEIAETNDEIRGLQQAMNSKPKGLAYMYKHKLENLLKKEMEKKADCCFRDLYARIRGCADEIRVEKTKKADDKKQMLMNLSCLVDRNKSRELGEELEKIRAEEGFTVRFTGPWPPYSFVALG
ncbi:MAG: GvpL/GvpF family gas vesicle protein [Candidatus Zixiibacteriota bacterium]